MDNINYFIILLFIKGIYNELLNKYCKAVSMAITSFYGRSPVLP